ncbi:hypothetical protein ES705_10626 [subsurface metagenome]
MKIDKNIVNLIESLTLAAGEHRKVDQPGRYFLLVSNSLATPCQIAIGGSSYQPWPVLYSARVEKDQDYFGQIRFYNPTAASMTVEYIISNLIIENASFQVSGVVSVSDISTAVETPAAVVALPLSFLINAAAAVDKGGGKVGIPLTSQPFATGEILTISGTVNYNGIAHVVDATSSANEVVITATYAAETFDGVDDRIGLTEPRSIAADADRKELVVHNHDGTYNIYWGDKNIDPANNRGIPIPSDAAYIIPNTGQIFFAVEAGAGVAGCVISY